MKKSRAVAVLFGLLLLLTAVIYIDLVGLDEKGTGSAADIKLGLDLAGGVSITYQVVGEEEPDATDMNDTIAKLQKRVYQYSTEAIVYQEGTNRINIEIPGVSDANMILQELGKPGALYFIAQTDAEGNENYSVQLMENGYYGYVLNKSIEELKEEGSVVLEGTDIKNAQAGTGQDALGNAEFQVELIMTEEGTAKFAEATRRAYGNGSNSETLAIYYDGSFVSVPKVNAVLTDGRASISPMESYEEAEMLASTIRIGGLKLELEELHSKVVGAQLGVDAIDGSLKAGAIGFVLVAIIMIAVYYAAGVASVLALVLYIALEVLLIRGFDMTLTLSGIAGIILSIGMAVDANVIIFARIREELGAGMSVRNAIKVGFEKAFSAILDGNITTIIAAAVLLLLAPGSIKGFAQTLALGIVLSMFTALLVTKWILHAFYALGIRDKKWFGVGKDRKMIPFLSVKGIFMGASLAVIAAGFIVMGVHKATTGDALNFNLEFKGGTATSVTFDEAMSLEEVNEQIVPLVEKIAGGAVQIQTVQDSREVIFKTSVLTVEQREEMSQMFAEQFQIGEEQMTTETISSTISDEMTMDTIIAVVAAIACMLLYIRIRFSDIRFGFSAVAALLHDVLVVLAFYAVTRISVGNTFIACMLTIVGYSINATIVIFDRVRENMAVMTRKDSLAEVVNRSITQTLSRSIFTSLTTLIMVVVLYILGVTSIRDFALPLIVGIICGAYSSVCLAGGLWYLLRVKFPPRVEE